MTTPTNTNDDDSDNVVDNDLQDTLPELTDPATISPDEGNAGTAEVNA